MKGTTFHTNLIFLESGIVERLTETTSLCPLILFLKKTDEHPNIEFNRINLFLIITVHCYSSWGRLWRGEPRAVWYEPDPKKGKLKNDISYDIEAPWEQQWALWGAGQKIL